VRRYSYCYPFLGLSAAQRTQLDKKGGNLLSISLFLALARARDVRIFHAHALKRLGGAVFTAARLQKKPFVVTLHGGVFDVPEAELRQMLQTLRHTFEWGKIFGFIYGSRRILDEADAVICVGAGEFEKARTSLPHDRIHHIGNGVDAEHFERGDGAAFRRRHHIPENAVVLACYSRFDPQKDQMCLVAAFDEAARSDERLYLVLAGPCTVADYVAKLDQRIAASPFASRIRRLGAIENTGSALPDAYHGCDIFVLPSRHEPFGIVVLEAWCAGKPVVAANVGGLKSLVRDGGNGLLFPTGDAAALTAQLRRLIACPALRDQFGLAGRQLARERYSWTRIGDETERVYQMAEERVRLRAQTRHPSLVVSPHLK